MADEKKEKKKSNRLTRVFIIAVTFGFIMLYSEPRDTTTSSTSTPKVNHYSSLQEAYNNHKNYIRHVCKEGVKLIDPNASNFEGPTYAGEYMGKFIVKGTSSNRLFRCEYIERENERGMNLNDVKRE